MWTLVLSIHIILCLFIIIIILLQSGKGSDMGAAFGGSSQTVFGPRGGATFLGKITTIIAVGFLVTCLALAYLTTEKRKSKIISEQPAIEEKAPAEAEKPAQMQEKKEAPKEEQKKSSEK